MTDDLLARIDQVTEEWDNWDGDSADAMRWTPDLPERGDQVRIGWDMGQVVIYAHWQAAGAAYWQLLEDMARALVPVVQGMQRLAAAAAEVAVVPGVRIGQAAQRAPRPKRPAHVPPMWADVPTQQRRRR